MSVLRHLKDPLSHLKHKFVRDAATLQIAGLLNRFSQAGSAIALAFLLGADGQGLFISAVALQALFYFLVNLGVAQATASQVAAASARGNTYKSAGWIAFMAKLLVFYGIGLLAFGFMLLPKMDFVLSEVGRLVAPFFERFPALDGFFSANRDSSYDDHRIWVWAGWLCALPILEAPRLVAAVAFQGTRRMKALAQLENGHEVVRFYLVILGAMVTGSPVGALLGMIAAGAIGSILGIELYREALHDDGEYPLPGVREIFRRARDIKIRQGIRQGLRIALLKNGQSLFGNVFPRLILLFAAGARWVTYFHIAQKIMEVPMGLAQGVTRTVLPALGELAGLKDMDSFRRLFARVTLITGSIITVAILCALPLIPPVMRAMFPEEYADPVFTFAWILAIGYIPFAFASAVDSFYIVSNQIKAWIWLTVLGAAITIPTNIYLILKINYTGTAWGLSLYFSWVLVHLAYITWFLNRHKELGLWHAAESDDETTAEEVETCGSSS